MRRVSRIFVLFLLLMVGLKVDAVAAAPNCDPFVSIQIHNCSQAEWNATPKGADCRVSTRSVGLKLNTTGATKMSFANVSNVSLPCGDPSITYSADQAYSATKSWMLLPGVGAKKVCVKFTNASNQSSKCGGLVQLVSAPNPTPACNLVCIATKRCQIVNGQPACVDINTQMTCADGFIDNFNTQSLDTTKWTIGDKTGSMKGQGVTLLNGNLVVPVSGSGSFISNGVGTKNPFNGNFIIESTITQFNPGSIATNGSAAAGLGNYQLSGNNYNSILWIKNAAGQSFVQMFNKNGNAETNSPTVPVPNGVQPRLKLERSGSSVSGWVDLGDGYVSVGNFSNTFLQPSVLLTFAQSINQEGSISWTAQFDNFSLSCLLVPRMLGDANRDNKVDLADFAIWKSEFISHPAIKKADFDNDGDSDNDDFEIWKRAFLNLPVVMPSATPTLSPTPTATPSAQPISCVPFSDDFSGTSLFDNWKSWSNGSGTALPGGMLTISLPSSTELPSSAMSMVESKKILSGNFSSEITLVSRNDNSTYEFFQFNDREYTGSSVNGFGFRLVLGSLKTEVYGVDNPTNPGAQDHGVVVANNVPVKLKLEKVGNIVNMYYDLMGGQGYQLLRTFTGFTKDSGYVMAGVQQTGSVNLAISGVFDNYQQACGVQP